jgi:hypothetical protein
MLRKLVVLLFAVFVFSSIASPATDKNWIFVSQDLAWHPQSDALKHYSYRLTTARILVFGNRGGFYQFDGTLIREWKSGPISIKYERGYRLGAGTWNQGDSNSISVRSRLIFVTVPKVGQVLPGPEVGTELKVNGQLSAGDVTQLDLNGRRYGVPADLPAREIEKLRQVIDFHVRQGASH